jgi:hypothetical protein
MSTVHTGTCAKCKELAKLLLEARDALPAISLASARLHGLDLTLADRIEAALEPWRDRSDSVTDEQNSICDAGSRASAEATASEGDDSTNGSATTEPAMESIAHVTSGPEATSSQGNHSKVSS